MSDRITMADLELQIVRLASALHRPVCRYSMEKRAQDLADRMSVEIVTHDDANYNEAISIDGAYGGWQLRIDGGGRALGTGGFLSKRELYERIQYALDVISRRREG